MAGLKTVNVVLFTRDEVRLTDSGDVLTGTHNEVIQIKKKPGRRTQVDFRSDMTSEEVRSVLENNFPDLRNRRFSCAARATQDDPRLDFRGERRVWDGETIRKLRGKSVLYLVMEDEPPVIREVFCRTESASSMQDHSWYNSNNSVHNQQLLPQSAPIRFSSGANCNTKANVENKSNLDAEIPLSPFFNESFDFEESMDGDFPQLTPGYLDDLLGMDSTQQNSQSQIAQGLGLTDQTSNPMTLPAFNNAWIGPVGATPPIAPVPQSQAYQNQVSEACSTNTDISGPPESGFSSEGNSSIDGQDLDLPQIIPSNASVEVKPSKGPLEGGGVFQLKFDQSLPDAVTSAWATFGCKQVEVRKTHESSFILHGESIPAGDVPGTVTVTITTKNGDYLGATSFTYVDREKEMLMHIIKSEKLLGELFTMLGKKYENVERGENNTQTFELNSDGRQRQALDLSFLRSLVYTAAGNGAEELIRMIFSTSAGRIVFDSYKKESPLPEDMADANGHEETATFLRAITKRFSEEDTTSHMQSGGTNWRNLSRAVEESEEQSVSWSSEKHVKQLEGNDLSERQYFGDAETSSSGSEEEKCHYEDQFEAKFSKDQDPIQMGLDAGRQVTERDIHDYQLAEKIGGKWKGLARALDSSDHCEANINRIQKDQGGSTKECFIEVFVCWMGREGRNATVGKLAEALGKVELKNIADELMRRDMTHNSGMRSKMELLETRLQDSERENSDMCSKMEHLEIRLQDSQHEGLGNHAVDAVTELEDVSGATRNDLDTDQEDRERRIAIQLKNLDEKLKKEVTSLLHVPEVKEDKLKTAVKLDLLTKLSESLQNIYSDIQAMVAETRKCNENFKRDFYGFAYYGLRAEHNELVLRVNDLESSQAEMSDEERKAFKRLQQYQNNRQKQVDRLENFRRGLFSSPVSLPETSSSYPTGGNNNSKKTLSRNRTDLGTRQKQTKSREGATGAGTPTMSYEENAEVCMQIKKRPTMRSIFRSKKSKENMCFPVSYRSHRDY